MEKPFVIYLDIDGVLVSYLKLKDYDPDGKHSFVPKSVEVLNTIISMFDAEICVVSSWGRPYWNGSKSGDDFKDFLLSRGIIVNNLTFGDPDNRADYVINRKLEGYTRFLILDDEFLEYYKKESEIGFNRILPVNSWRCLDEYDLVGVTRNYTRLASDEY